MFCNQSLGSNEVIETFPVGRRLAFDAAKGRLWVVCRKCERWNLTPLEARWEAVEACERLFRATRLRVSTDNIGLARHAEGLELVRVGSPMRPEFAAWRYGDQFGRRRIKSVIFGTGAAALLLGVSFVDPAILGGSGMGGYFAWQLVDGWLASRTQTKLRTDQGRIIKLRRDDLPTVRLRPAEQGSGFRLSILKGKKQEWFEGGEAERFASQIVPKVNKSGGRRRTVEDAVGQIEFHGHPDAFLSEIVAGDRFVGKGGVPGYIAKMPTPTRLALEMALHEEEERRALEGELWRLEQAWEAAEEIASISDDLLVPEASRQFLDSHRSDAEQERGEDSS
jgi:hypothetical protein